MRIVIILLIVAGVILAFNYEASAKGCSAKVKCYCNSGNGVSLGSRDVNGECASIFGMCVTNCITKNNTDLLHAIDLCNDSYGSKCQELTDDGSISQYEIKGKDRDGDVRFKEYDFK
jgi:hypothetical protein